MSEREITKISDLEGLKFRVAGGVVSDIANKLGIVGILKPAPEAYTLLSNGVADGVMFPMEAIKSFNLAELVPYTTRVPDGLYNVSFFFAMNEAKRSEEHTSELQSPMRISYTIFCLKQKRQRTKKEHIRYIH